MKKNVPRKELIEKAKAWLASFSNEELAKKLESEKYCLERDRTEFLAWLTSNNPQENALPDGIERNPKPEQDTREFRWSLNPRVEKYDIPDSSASHHEGFLLEAA